MTEAFVRHESGVQYLTSPLLDAHGVPHLFSLRGGGVSPGVFASLNFAQGSGGLRDTAENVLENHARAAAVFGLPVSRVCRSYQTHSLTVRLVDDRDAGRGLTLPPFDGAWTDCTPERPRCCCRCGMPTACPCCSATGEAARSPPCIRAGGARSAASRRTPSAR